MVSVRQDETPRGPRIPGPAQLLADRRSVLIARLQDGLHQAPAESRAFAARLLASAAPGPPADPPIALPGDEELERDLTTTLRSVPTPDTLTYGGAPEVAATGYSLGARATGVDLDTLASRFLQGLERLRQRPPAAQREWASNELILLGLADGLREVGRLGHPWSAGVGPWLADLVAAQASATPAGARLRELALELLDPRGRLLARVDGADATAVAMDLAVRRTWQDIFGSAPGPDESAREGCLAHLLLCELPYAGDVGQAAIALSALEVLVRATVAVLAPRIDTVVEVLRRTQTALRRWRWERQPRTRNAVLTQWRLDNEYHVQAILWAVLYPLFGEALRDEEYLQSFGFTQPRADLAITTIRAIIEVKFVRTAADFAAIEEQVAGDLGLYFANPAQFDHMVAYIYDDADDHRPEEYDRLRNALRLRDSRIRDVVIVRRPSQIPSRAERRSRDLDVSTPANNEQ